MFQVGIKKNKCFSIRSLGSTSIAVHIFEDL